MFPFATFGNESPQGGALEGLKIAIGLFTCTLGALLLNGFLIDDRRILLPVTNSTLTVAAIHLTISIGLYRVGRFLGPFRWSSFLSIVLTTLLFFACLFALIWVPYSRSVLLVGVSISLVWLATDQFFQANRKSIVHVVPGGDIHDLKKFKSVAWKLIEHPDEPIPPGSYLVADFRYSHSEEWDSMITASALNGIKVYHARIMRETLSGTVEFDKFTENAAGVLAPDPNYKFVKRIIDLFSALLISPFLLVIGVFVAIAIKLIDGGPVIFKQERIGFRGRPFTIYKFRTMRNKSVVDAAGEKTTYDANRITRLGNFLRKSRLDEIPQIVNILLGQMSWIGPRPETSDLVDNYGDAIPQYQFRHIVYPGLSGWAQVNQGHVTDLDGANKKLQYDLFYIKNYSLWLDAVIAFKTVATLFLRFGSK